jgi:methyl-accepting chemotaxis protein
MRLFTKLPILLKFISAFAVVLLFTIGLGLFSNSRIGLMTDAANGLEANIQGDMPIAEMARSGPQIFALAATSALVTAPSQLAQIANLEDIERKQFKANWSIYQPTMDPGRESNDGDGFAGAFNQLSNDASLILQDAQAGNQPAAAALITGAMPALQATFNHDIADDLSRQTDLAGGHVTVASNAESSSLSGILIALAATALAICGLVWLLISSIGKPIAALTLTMGRLAQGDLNAAIDDVTRPDEIGRMACAVQVFRQAAIDKTRLESETEAARAHSEAERKTSEAEREVAASQQLAVVNALAGGLERLSGGELIFRLTTPFSTGYEKLRRDYNNAMETLHKTVTSIAANTQGVRSAAGEITAASDDLARRTEQQAATVEQTAAALDEITATVKANASNALAARDVVNAAKADAERSGEIVRETVAAVSGIEQSSRRISDIIGVIDEIAFQTNLLALNAGVEAARAGDAGRGFAVVATEVRALAQRSADAAKEIKTLISASGAQVATGVKLVGETGQSLIRIAEQVAQLNSLVSGIAASAQEQATSLAQVNTAVSQMDQVTQQNAAMVEQTTAASHALAEEASELTRLVAKFNTGALPPPGGPLPSAAARARTPKRHLAEASAGWNNG